MMGYIFIAKNDVDIVDFYSGHIGPEQLEKCLEIPDEDFDYYELRLFDFINVECDILIDKYEEETLESSMIPKAIEIVSVLIHNSDDDKFIKLSNDFLELLYYAYENGKNVEFKF